MRYVVYPSRVFNLHLGPEDWEVMDGDGGRVSLFRTVQIVTLEKWRILPIQIIDSDIANVTIHTSLGR